MYYYRLNMDEKGHIGQGRKTSPCLTLERFEQEEKSLCNTLVEAALTGRARLGGVIISMNVSLSLGRD